MKNISKNQRGFNATGAVIALIAIFVIAGLAYGIVNIGGDNNKSAGNSSNTEINNAVDNSIGNGLNNEAGNFIGNETANDTGNSIGNETGNSIGNVDDSGQNRGPGGGDDDVRTKVFNVEGKPFSFTPNEIRVKKGDRVRIVFSNVEGFHDWKIDEFNAATKKINAGETDTIEFIAGKTGTFEFYCSVGTHRQMGMKGNLIVE
ncbi:MAG: cupredoxin domain-containing protein [Patescibacteria group bacterium]|jgi:cytochrome c oxidase subunit 2